MVFWGWDVIIFLTQSPQRGKGAENQRNAFLIKEVYLPYNGSKSLNFLGGAFLRFGVLVFHLCFTFSCLLFLSNAQDFTCSENLLIESNVPDEIYHEVANLLAFSRVSLSIESIQFDENGRSLSSNDFHLSLERTNLRGIQQLAILSPDGKRILQTFENDEGKRTLIITSLYAGDPELMVVEEGNWNISSYWLNTDYIVVDIVIDRAERHIIYTLVNVNDGEIENLQVTVSDETFHPIGNPMLSPDMNMIGYVELSNESQFIVIYNDSTDSVTRSPELNFPRLLSWSPTSQHIGFIQNPNADNAPTELGFFNPWNQELTTYPIATSRNVKSPSFTFQWSPSGNNAIYSDGELEFREAYTAFPKIITLSTEAVTPLCLPGEAIWSPNERYIFVLITNPPRQNKGFMIVGTFVFDMQTSTLFEVNEIQIEKIGRILGWANIKE